MPTKSVDMPDVPRSIAGRLRAERERLKLSREAAAKLMGVTPMILDGWEKPGTDQVGTALKMLGRVGGDVLFIVTGERSIDAEAAHQGGASRFLRALAELNSDERQRLLLHLVADELAYRRRY